MTKGTSAGKRGGGNQSQASALQKMKEEIKKLKSEVKELKEDKKKREEVEEGEGEEESEEKSEEEKSEEETAEEEENARAAKELEDKREELRAILKHMQKLHKKIAKHEETIGFLERSNEAIKQAMEKHIDPEDVRVIAETFLRFTKE